MKIRQTHIIFIILVSSYQFLYCQNLRINADKYEDLVERLYFLYPEKNYFSTSMKNYNVEEVKQMGFEKFEELNKTNQMLFIDFINQYDHNKIQISNDNEETISKVDSLFYRYDNQVTDSSIIKLTYKNRKPILKYFYKNPHHFLSLNTENFVLRADPIVQLSFGNASNDTSTIFQNTRGLELSALIDKKVYVYTRILENQQSFLPHTNQYIIDHLAIPNNGFYKAYNSNVSSLNGFDFLNAQAYVGLPISKSIAVEFGHGQHFIGNGMRSLLLSNFSNNYFYLRFNTKVWKLNYQNLFAELSGLSSASFPGDNLLPKKYIANHFLTFKPFKRMEVGIFESIVFSRENNFDFQYLNPVILYRMVEQFIGSPDNALVGLNMNYLINKKIMFYGQFILDEFNLEQAKKEGWWGNKYGFQVGLNTKNIVNGLDLSLEYNMTRPYTYTHNRPLDKDYAISSYSHYSMPLAHPLGANFRETLLSAKYTGLNKFYFHALVALMEVGRDPDGKNFGSNVLKNNKEIEMEFGNKLLQGDANKILFLKLNASYEIAPNYKIFINPQLRKSESINNKYNKNFVYLGGGISINLDMDKNIY